MENKKELPSKEIFERLLRNEMHSNLIIVNEGTDEHPDYVIRGTELVVLSMIGMLYETK